MDIEVRRIRAGEGADLREIRLAALADAPSAFASTVAAESAYPESRWEDAAASRSEGDGSSTFVAEGPDGWAGVVGAFAKAGSRRSVELVSMWVRPQLRRSRIGLDLVRAVIGWARETGGDVVELWVAEGNEAATALYERAGFSMTDAVQPLPSHPCHTERRMVLELRRTGGSCAVR